MKKITVSILTTLLMLSMVFSSSVFAAEKEVSAWESFLGLFSAKTAATTDVGVEYRGHIQNVGNYPLDGTWIQGPTELGTEGQSLRLEGFWIQLNGDVPAGAHIEYQVHVQNVGWMDPVQDGAFAGTEGKSQQIEAIKISLVDDEGVQLEDYSVVYTGHVQNKGDVGPYTNGEQLGTDGEFLRLEAITVEIVQNEADLTEYEAALAAVTQADYTAASWTAYQAVVNANVVDEDNLQSEVDAATAAITAAQANLVLVPKVTSVTAINAKTLVVAFNSAVDPATVVDDNDTTADLTDDNLIDGAITVASLDGHAVTINNALASLSADKKTLTLVIAGGGEYLSGRYDVKVPAGAIKTPAGDAVLAYSTTIDVKDTVAPTIISTTSVTSSTVKVVFSEPMLSLGTMTFALSDGTVVAGSGTGVTNDFNAATNNKEVTFTIGSAVAANKNVTATIIGASDFAGNLLAPNPATVTLHKGDKDGIAPTVSSVKFLNAASLEVTFSEEVSSFDTADMTVNTLAPSDVEQDTTNKAKYKVTLSGPVSDIVDVVVVAAGITDLSGEPMAENYVTRILVSADTTDPTLTSATVVKGTDNAEYLELTFSEDVTKLLTATFSLAGTKTTDYVTEGFTGTIDNADLVAVVGTTNKFRIKLADVYTAALVEGTSYSLALPVSMVKDTSNNENAVAADALVFTRGEDGVPADYTYQTVASVNQATNDTITVVFGSVVDGASATNKANYAVQGTTISSATLAADKKTVTLNLVQDATTYTGARYITINNVKTAALVNLEEAYNEPVTLTENVRPTVVSALATADNEITLTFSEDVVVGAAKDFNVYFNGTIDTVGGVVAVIDAGNAKKVTLTTTGSIDAAALAAGITVEKASTCDLTDANTNALNMPSAVTVTLN